MVSTPEVSNSAYYIQFIGVLRNLTARRFRYVSFSQWLVGLNPNVFADSGIPADRVLKGQSLSYSRSSRNIYLLW